MVIVYDHSFQTFLSATAFDVFAIISNIIFIMHIKNNFR